MTDNTLRTAIARAIAEGLGEDYDQAVMFRQMNFVGAADAVLKVIADPPAEVVERCAESIAPAGVFGTTLAQYSLARDNYRAEDQEDEKSYARADVRAVLAALVGGESDE